MLYLVSSNGYTTSSIYLRTLDQATEAYLALRGLPSFKDAVWTLKTERHWLHDHANGVGEPDWWYEAAPNLYAPYREGQSSQAASDCVVRDRRRTAVRRSGKPVYGAAVGSRAGQLQPSSWT
jgi:hypothetical protein